MKLFFDCKIPYLFAIRLIVSVLNLFLYVEANSQRQTLVIIEAKDITAKDLMVEFSEDVNVSEVNLIKSPMVNGSCRFEFPLFKSVAYFRIENFNKNMEVLSFMLIEPGDSVCLKILEENIVFSGRGSAKLQFLYEENKKRNSYLPHRARESFDTYFDFLNTRENAAISHLNGWKSKLSHLSYSILMADLIGYAECRKMQSILRDYKIGLNDEGVKNIYRTTSGAPFGLTTNDTTILSFYYRDFLYNRILVELIIQGKSNRSFEEIYLAISNKLKGLAKIKMHAYHIISSMRLFGVNQENEFWIKDFINYCNQREYKGIVETMFNKVKNFLAQGAEAKNFSLENELGEKISLSDLKNKVVVLDYWFTGCVPCKQIVPVMTAIKKKFLNNPDVVFVNICIDKERSTWLKSIGVFASAGGIQLYTGGETENHPVVKDYNVSGYPKLIVIDKLGKIVNANVPAPENANAGELIDAIEYALKKSNSP